MIVISNMTGSFNLYVYEGGYRYDWDSSTTQAAEGWYLVDECMLKYKLTLSRREEIQTKYMKVYHKSVDGFFQ